MSSTSTRRTTIGIAAALFAAVFGGARAHAQASDPDGERARQLVLRIRSSMKEIDTLLLTGAQPAKTEQALAENVKRIEDLLNEAESKSQAVVQGIDELIQLAKRQQSQSSSGGGDDSSKQKSPSQSDPKNLPQRSKSQEQELQQQPPSAGAKPQDPKDRKNEEQKNGDPKAGQAGSKPAQRDATRPPPEGPTGEFERKDVSGRWGMLPPKEAEDLQRRNADDFPQRYRRWMELYFQRVNRLPSRDH